jgi:hypothetical protein
MIRLNRLWSAIALLLLAWGPASLPGQSLGSGSVAGVVRNEAGEPLAVSLVLRHEESGIARSITTPRNGRFEFAFLPPGEYSLRAEQFGLRPQLIRGVVVRPGQAIEIPLTLGAAPEAVERIDTVAFRGALLAGRGPGLVVELARSRTEGYPDERRELTELGRYSSLSNAELEMQGLPAALSGIRVDGMPVSTLESPSLIPGSLRAAAFPLSMFEHAALVATNPDVEWSGVAGGTLDGFTRRGARQLGATAFGLWTGEALASGGAASGERGQTVQGGFQVGGPLIPDTASLVVGVEAWRLAAPASPAWARGPAAEQAIRIARETYGIDPGAGGEGSDVVSAFGRFAWQISPATHLDARANFAFLPSAAGDLVRPATALTRPYDGRDLFAGATLTTRFSDRVYQEVRLGVDGVSRDYQGFDAAELAGARVLSAGVALGLDGSQPGSFQRSTLRASETLHVRSGDHRLKLGLSAGLGRVEVGPAAAADVFFSDPEAFAAGLGFFVRAEPGAGTARFTVPQAALFAQDSWAAGPGLSILAGVRLDVERLPAGEVEPNPELRELAGLDNTNVGATWWRLSPRVGFTWDLQDRHEWVIAGSAGVYSGSVDPLLLGNWIHGSGGARIGRGFGTLEGRADVPDGAVVPVEAPALMLLDPGFEAPRTFRASLGVSRTLGASTALHLSGLFRHTDFLPRFSDLNLLPQAAARDQFGRAVFGQLRQQGGLLFAEPESNRRFAGLDRVIAANVDGRSTYRALSASVEHQPGGGIELFAGYTYSATEDNWIPSSGTALELPLAPFPTGEGTDWMEGRSDFDVPHRAVAGVELSSGLLGGLRTGVFYRYRSGSPFTPGFRDGVDANADGSFRNDPAFVDRSIPGMEALLDGWECLQDQMGGFAERNSCRTGGMHSLDARVALGVTRLGRYTAELIVDGINLLATRADLPDPALYLLDPAGSVAGDAATGRFTVPLVANENFGRPLGLLGSGRRLQLGFRLSH